LRNGRDQQYSSWLVQIREKLIKDAILKKWLLGFIAVIALSGLTDFHKIWQDYAEWVL